MAIFVVLSGGELLGAKGEAMVSGRTILGLKALGMVAAMVAPVPEDRTAVPSALEEDSRAGEEA